MGLRPFDIRIAGENRTRGTWTQVRKILGVKSVSLITPPPKENGGKEPGTHPLRWGTLLRGRAGVQRGESSSKRGREAEEEISKSLGCGEVGERDPFRLVFSTLKPKKKPYLKRCAKKEPTTGRGGCNSSALGN